MFSRYGIGGTANGGGGGGYQNTGGGGGSNIGSGYYTGNGIPDPTYNASWALDLSNPPNPNPGLNGTGTVVFTALNGKNFIPKKKRNISRQFPEKSSKQNPKLY